MLQKFRNSRLASNKYWLIASTILLGVVLAFLVVDIYNKTLDAEKANHQKRQLEMVKTTVQGIDYVIKNLVNDLKFLRSYPDVKKMQPSTLSFLSFYLRRQVPVIVQTIYFTNPKGMLKNAVGDEFPHWAEQDIVGAIQHANPKDEFIISAVNGEADTNKRKNLFFQMLVPIHTDNKTAPQSIIGYLGYQINFSSLIDQFIKPLKLTKDDFAWVIDGDGRLIYHPMHKEMIFHSTKNTRDECFECHSSFESHRRIIASTKPEYGEFEVIKNAPANLLIYYPFLVQSVKWIIVISTPVPKVTEGLREKFKVFFVLGFIILGVLTAFGVLLYRVNARVIRAEEAKRSLEQIQEYREQLNQSTRLASIGELVDTVAHEINTPAGIISAHIDALLLGWDKRGDITKTLELIKKQTKRISEYTNGLLNYSRRMAFKPEPVDLRDLLDECIFLLSHRHKLKPIYIKKEYEQDLPKIFGDIHQLEQVCLNLLNNSIDAIESNGTITIRAEKNASESGEYAHISIEDTGNGIDDENIDKIFTPFFSTKPGHQGTGLGLSIVKAIINRHHGSITIRSQKGKGTVVLLVIPVQH
ncbi:MAG: ATP-binding protein [Ignavibacteriales bacterium]|nr:ATP-binding protein [Ignavibacteriales bacterium]